MESKENIRLKQLRTQKNKKGYEIAKVLGISPQYYSGIEKGKRKLTADMVETLSKFYQVSVDYILDTDFSQETIVVTDKQLLENYRVEIDGIIASEEELVFMFEMIRKKRELFKDKEE
ncbi:helix-turn-helix transcriptional regulator (plasmid) [Aneurinibacillus sp. Ricciae_BoGa-3]|uniref:helix-turn-helix domain-containing protein n=1 Tax=Aneurinibacillus sp. Ricciae_BoGa-3 TaxID=3022697 RepID=UPI002342569A|nr:helix-turn-helix transcriptional regulator [Aneurinibacillus sp. Ricciae_BoGa-3]WCK57484.1 helix-turn-helix transcriptional regulator [Aneurinibacillus sp. Ricciae_BoGa-3]